jgi:hypothetical protein
MVMLAAAEPVAASTDVAIPRDAIVYDTNAFWPGTRRGTVPAGVSKVRLKGNINWTFGGSGYRHVWVHRKRALFFGAAKESDLGDSGVQNLGTGVVNVTPGDYFELVARLRVSWSTSRKLRIAELAHAPRLREA